MTQDIQCVTGWSKFDTTWEGVAVDTARILLSARTQNDVIYREELEQPDSNADGLLTLTRAQPPGWTGYAQRVDSELLRDTAWPAGERPLAFVCGPTCFVEAVASSLVALGYEPRRVKTERFGASGSP